MGSSSVTTAQCGSRLSYSIFGANKKVILQKSKLKFANFGNNPLNLFRVLCHAVEVFRLKERVFPGMITNNIARNGHKMAPLSKTTIVISSILVLLSYSQVNAEY